MDKENTISLKQHFDELLNAKFKWIDQRFYQSEKSARLALSAQKELYQTVQKSSKEAITKAEEAQKQYNQSHNDLARKMESQYKEMLPRPEADQRQKAMEEKLEEYHKQLNQVLTKQSQMDGKSKGISDFAGWIISGVLFLIYVLEYLDKTP